MLTVPLPWRPKSSGKLPGKPIPLAFSEFGAPHYFHFIMARGNQRDLARAKNQKKQKEASKSQKKSGDPTKRMESDADRMRQKQAEGMFTSCAVA